MDMLIKGRVWKFGHNVDTDVMAPWNSLTEPWEERRKVILHIRPEFAQEAKPGDIIVAGRNWGCGSSRENAPENLKNLGIGAVVAETYGRIYFRNSVAIAFPNIVCPGVHEAFEEGDEMELDLKTARVRNLTRDIEISGQPYTSEMLNILEKGGLLNVLKERLSNEVGG
ncbi:MAG: 3-isopropylmalate dehydratase [Deltaproteobacteria bacterium]|nr:3-isopropylmalate dehydratase [Deltaproteobacteria bacterium]MBW2050930.1 3-isopropylmalate dehydratase [Deltaproteobacteria bacterium]MBW2141185.1 3-isopropylmalate dehydratase [Deltaproteobacteria bacterium]MBW2323697.1 3-isopropylmalate dehydratase [Deltaproteobacteria bacterium]